MMIMTVVTANTTGCNLMSNDDRMKKAEELLEEKYQEEFEVLEYNGLVNIDNDEYQVVASAKNKSDILFEARISLEDNYLSDEYITSRVCRMMEEKMQHLKQGTAFSEGTETRHYSMKWQDYWRDVKTRHQEGLE